MFELFGAIIAVTLIPTMLGLILPVKYINWGTRWLWAILIIGIVMSLVYNPLSYVIIILLALLGLGRFVIHIRKQSVSIQLNYPLVIGIVAVSILLLITWSDVLNNPLDPGVAWDSAVTWFTKAKQVYFWGSFNEMAMINYPNTGANLWAFVMSFSSLNEQLGRLIFPFIYAIWFAIIVRDVKNKPYSLVLLLPLIATGIYFLLPGTVNGYQDIFLGVVAATSIFLLGNTIYCKYSDVQQKRWDFILGLFFCGSIPLVKNEGLVFALIIFACFVFIYSIQNFRTLKNALLRNWKLVLLGIVLAILPIILWNSVLVFHNVDLSNIQGNFFTIEGIKGIPGKLSSFPLIWDYVVGYTDRIKIVIALAIFSTLVATLVAFNKRKAFLNVFLWLIVIAYILFILLTFLATNADIVWHLGTAANRLMMQLNLIYALIFILNTAFILDSAYKAYQRKE